MNIPDVSVRYSSDPSWRPADFCQRSFRGTILHFTRWWLIGGAEAYICSMAECLYDWAHYVVVEEPDYVPEMFFRGCSSGLRGIYFSKTGASPALLAALRPDVVIYHTWSADGVDSSRIPGVFYVSVCHGNWPYVRPHMHRHVAVSRTSTENIDPEYRRWFTVIPGCVNPFDFTVEKLPQNSPNRLGEFVVGRYGSARRDKYGEALFDIFERVDNTFFLVVGGDSLRPGMNRPALAGRVRLVYPTVVGRAALLAQMDAAIYLNRKDIADGYSLSVLEMRASAIPIVSEARGGVLDQIENERTGFLVPFDQPDAFVEKLCWLRDHPVERVAMGRAARAACERENSYPNFRDRWLALLNGKWS